MINISTLIEINIAHHSKFSILRMALHFPQNTTYLWVNKAVHYIQKFLFNVYRKLTRPCHKVPGIKIGTFQWRHAIKWTRNMTHIEDTNWRSFNDKGAGTLHYVLHRVGQDRRLQPVITSRYTAKWSIKSCG